MKYRCLLLMLLSLAIMPLAFADDDADDNTARDDRQVYRLFDGIDLVAAIKLQYGKSRIVTKSVYPQLETQYREDGVGVDSFNQVVANIVQEEVDHYRTTVANNAQHQKDLPKAALKNDLFIDFDTSSIKSGENHLISIRFSIQGYLAGMAHPYHVHRVLNYDLNNSQQLVLGDLFEPNSDYLIIFSNYARKQLIRRLNDVKLIAAGTTPTVDNFKNWNLKPYGILITFEEYQVAPQVKGAQTVLVPYTLLESIIPKNSPIASCVKHRRACAENNVLTGGFIDQAINTKHSRFNPILSAR